MAFLQVFRLLEEEKRERRKTGWVQSSIRGRTLRSNVDIFAIREAEFVATFRVSKELAQELIQKLEPYCSGKGKNAISPEKKVLALLHCLGSGAFQKDVGHNYLIGMSQKTISRIIRTLVPALVNNFKEEVKFPTTAEERAQVTAGFRKLGPFEGVLGCMDCTHIAISQPREREEDFVNHKGYHSLNAQMVCDSNLMILHVIANFPGRVHDQFIWSGCDLYHEMKRLYERKIGEYYFLGDSGYGLEPFLLTPILNARLGSPEDKYTKAHCAVRNLIERCFGVLKARWRILHKSRQVTYDPELAAQIVNCCAILHNMCIKRKIAVPRSSDISEAHASEDIDASSHFNARQQALKKREDIVRKYFQD